MWLEQAEKILKVGLIHLEKALCVIQKGPVCDSKRLGHHFESFRTLSVMHPSGGKKG